VVGLCVGVLGTGGWMYYYKEPSAAEKLALEMLAERRETKKQMIRQLAEQTFLTILDIPGKENKTFEELIADYPMSGSQEEKEFLVVLKELWADGDRKREIVAKREYRDAYNKAVSRANTQTQKDWKVYFENRSWQTSR
jgi:hypothetical protein